MKTLLKSIKIAPVLCVFSSTFYILVLWLFARVTGPDQDNAGVVTLNDRVVDAANVGRRLTEDVYFRGHPSCAGDGYDVTSSSGNNKGPINPGYLAEVKSCIDTFLVHHPYLSRRDVPVEMATTSSSGLDPDITPQSAYVQVEGVIQARGVDIEEVRGIIDKAVEKPLLGVFGTEKVNVLELNIALEETKVNRK